jgi:hypothetical protein
MKPNNLSITQAVHGLHDIVFDCPKCGPPYQIGIKARFGGLSSNPGIWAWEHDAEYRLTITPSIDNQHHGRKKQCGWHGSITNGEIV